MAAKVRDRHRVALMHSSQQESEFVRSPRAFLIAGGSAISFTGEDGGEAAAGGRSILALLPVNLWFHAQLARETINWPFWLLNGFLKA